MEETMYQDIRFRGGKRIMPHSFLTVERGLPKTTVAKAKPLSDVGSQWTRLWFHREAVSKICVLGVI